MIEMRKNFWNLYHYVLVRSPGLHTWELPHIWDIERVTPYINTYLNLTTRFVEGVAWNDRGIRFRISIATKTQMEQYTLHVYDTCANKLMSVYSKPGMNS